MKCVIFLIEDCKICVFCLDMKKNGGLSVLKQRCQNKVSASGHNIVKDRPTKNYIYDF